jgi:hypothetical protein
MNCWPRRSDFRGNEEDPMTMRLSLHTWTLDTTPLAEALAVI